MAMPEPRRWVVKLFDVAAVSSEASHQGLLDRSRGIIYHYREYVTPLSISKYRKFSRLTSLSLGNLTADNFNRHE